MQRHIYIMHIYICMYMSVVSILPGTYTYTYTGTGTVTGAIYIYIYAYPLINVNDVRACTCVDLANAIDL